MDGAAIEAPTPVARPAGAGRRWEASAQGRPLTVTATERVCTDTMTGMPHPLEVSVGHDGRDWRGCGGEAAMLQERRFLDRLKSVSRFEITPEGALRLLGDGPGSLLARR